MPQPDNAPRRHGWRLLLPCAALTLALAGCGQDSPDALVKSGEAFLAKNDPVSASVQLKAALQQQPESTTVRLLLARTLLDSADPASAAVELQKLREQGYDANNVVPLLARALLGSGDLKRLVTQFDALELSAPMAQASLKTSLASAWTGLSNRVKADAALAQALVAQPSFAPALILQSELRGDAGDIDGALLLVDKALAAQPTLAEAWYAKGSLLAFGKRDLAGGKAAFEKALAVNRFFVPAYAGLASLALREKDPKAATAQAAALRAVLPAHPHATFIDAQVAHYSGRIDEAREKSQALLRVAPDNVGVLTLAGVVEGTGGSFVIAESHFVKALTIDPQLDSARRSLALTYLNLGQHTRALETLKTLIGPDSKDAAALAMAGAAALSLSDARAAESYYTRSATLNPGDAYVNTSLALTQLKRGNVDRGFAELSELTRSTGKETVADMALISARMSRAEWPQALQALDTALAKSPKDVNLLDLRGRVHIARNDLPAARVAFEQAAALDPKFFTATANLAAVDLLEKKPDDAARRLQQALKNDPRNVYAGLALADLRAKAGAPLPELQRILAESISGNPSDARPRVELIELNLRNKRAREALQVAQDATSALPNDPGVLDALARALTVNGDVQQAISTYRRLSNLDPRDVRPLLRLAELYRSGGERKSAEAMWRRVAEVHPGYPAVQSRIVELLIADKRPGDALAEARAMQQRNADSVIGFIYEGTVHQRAKEWDQAAAALRRGLARHPTSAEIAIRLFQTELRLGRTADAARLAERWPKDNPQDTEFEIEFANLLMLRNDLPGAERALRGAVARHPDRPVALNNLSMVLTMQRKPGAVAAAEKALALTSETAAMLDTLALALGSEEQFVRALDVQRRAVALAPDDPALRVNYARLAIQAGNKALAREELDALAARGKDFPLRAEVEKLQKLL